MPDLYRLGQKVRVCIDAEIADFAEDNAGRRTLIVRFQAGRMRLLEFPADAESVTVEAVQS